jgi:hypothetical protein
MDNITNNIQIPLFAAHILTTEKNDYTPDSETEPVLWSQKYPSVSVEVNKKLTIHTVVF